MGWENLYFVLKYSDIMPKQNARDRSSSLTFCRVFFCHERVFETTELNNYRSSTIYFYVVVGLQRQITHLVQCFM